MIIEEKHSKMKSCQTKKKKVIFLVLSKWIDIECHRTVTLQSLTCPLPLALWITRSLFALLPTWQWEVVAWIIPHSFSFITSLLESLRSSWSILLSLLSSCSTFIANHRAEWSHLMASLITDFVDNTKHYFSFPPSTSHISLKNSRLPLWPHFSLSETPAWQNWSDIPTEKTTPLHPFMTLSPSTPSQSIIHTRLRILV